MNPQLTAAQERTREWFKRQFWLHRVPKNTKQSKDILELVDALIVSTWNDAVAAADEVVREHGHQQDDDTIWCNMDDTLQALSKLKSP